MKRIINKVKSSSDILKNPGKALKDFSFEVIQKYVIISFTILFILLALSFWAGFVENHIFFQITFFFFAVITTALAIVFYRIRKGISYIAQRLDAGVKRVIKERNSRVVDVDPEE